MATTKELVMGALIGTFIGSLAAAKRKEIQDLLEKHTGTVAEKTKALAEFMVKEHKLPWAEEHHEKNHFFTGSALGMLAGASAMLLMTPKTGKMIRNQLSKSFKTALTHTQKTFTTIKKKAKSMGKGAKKTLRKTTSKKKSLRPKRAKSKSKR